MYLIASLCIKGVFKGVQTPPPHPEIFRFFLKNEGKEVRKREKKVK